MPLEKRSRARAQIDRDVENFAVKAGHDLGLGVRRMLEVHAADRTGAERARAIDLLRPGAESLFRQHVRAVKPAEEATRVLEILALDDEQAVNAAWFG